MTIANRSLEESMRVRETDLRLDVKPDVDTRDDKNNNNIKTRTVSFPRPNSYRVSRWRAALYW